MSPICWLGGVCTGGSAAVCFLWGGWVCMWVCVFVYIQICTGGSAAVYFLWGVCVCMWVCVFVCIRTSVCMCLHVGV
jgi:hypothetical protein